MSSFSSTSSSKTPSSSMASSGASKSSSLSQSLSLTVRRARNNEPDAVGEAEKAARRDAQMKAAQDRLQSWDKKISTTRKQKIVSESRKSAEESEEMALSEETLRSIDLAKEYERKVALVSEISPSIRLLTAIAISIHVMIGFRLSATTRSLRSSRRVLRMPQPLHRPPHRQRKRPPTP